MEEEEEQAMDIYEDLPNFEMDKEFERLQNESKVLHDKMDALNANIATLRQEKNKLNKLNKVLQRNISILLKTAKQELTRKDRIINDLRKEVQYFQRKLESMTSGGSENYTKEVNLRTPQEQLESGSKKEDKVSSSKIVQASLPSKLDDNGGRELLERDPPISSNKETLRNKSDKDEAKKDGGVEKKDPPISKTKEIIRNKSEKDKAIKDKGVEKRDPQIYKSKELLPDQCDKDETKNSEGIQERDSPVSKNKETTAAILLCDDPESSCDIAPEAEAHFSDRGRKERRQSPSRRKDLRTKSREDRFSSRSDSRGRREGYKVKSRSGSRERYERRFRDDERGRQGRHDKHRTDYRRRNDSGSRSHRSRRYSRSPGRRSPSRSPGRRGRTNKFSDHDSRSRSPVVRGRSRTSPSKRSRSPTPNLIKTALAKARSEAAERTKRESRSDSPAEVKEVPRISSKEVTKLKSVCADVGAPSRETSRSLSPDAVPTTSSYSPPDKDGDKLVADIVPVDEPEPRGMSEESERTSRSWHTAKRSQASKLEDVEEGEVTDSEDDIEPLDEDDNNTDWKQSFKNNRPTEKTPLTLYSIRMAQRLQERKMEEEMEISVGGAKDPEMESKEEERKGKIGEGGTKEREMESKEKEEATGEDQESDEPLDLMTRGEENEKFASDFGKALSDATSATEESINKTITSEKEVIETNSTGVSEKAVAEASNTFSDVTSASEEKGNKRNTSGKEVLETFSSKKGIEKIISEIPSEKEVIETSGKYLADTRGPNVYEERNMETHSPCTSEKETFSTLREDAIEINSGTALEKEVLEADSPNSFGEEIVEGNNANTCGKEVKEASQMGGREVSSECSTEKEIVTTVIASTSEKVAIEPSEREIIEINSVVSSEVTENDSTITSEAVETTSSTINCEKEVVESSADSLRSFNDSESSMKLNEGTEISPFKGKYKLIEIEVSPSSPKREAQVLNYLELNRTRRKEQLKSCDVQKVPEVLINVPEELLSSGLVAEKELNKQEEVHKISDIKNIEDLVKKPEKPLSLNLIFSSEKSGETVKPTSEPEAPVLSKEVPENITEKKIQLEKSSFDIHRYRIPKKKRSEDSSKEEKNITSVLERDTRLVHDRKKIPELKSVDSKKKTLQNNVNERQRGKKDEDSFDRKKICSILEDKSNSKIKPNPVWKAAIREKQAPVRKSKNVETQSGSLKTEEQPANASNVLKVGSPSEKTSKENKNRIIESKPIVKRNTEAKKSKKKDSDKDSSYGSSEAVHKSNELESCKNKTVVSGAKESRKEKTSEKNVKSRGGGDRRNSIESEKNRKTSKGNSKESEKKCHVQKNSDVVPTGDARSSNIRERLNPEPSVEAKLEKNLSPLRRNERPAPGKRKLEDSSPKKEVKKTKSEASEIVKENGVHEPNISGNSVREGRLNSDLHLSDSDSEDKSSDDESVISASEWVAALFDDEEEV